MRWTTANPQTAGLSGSIGESAMFVDVAAPTATATRMVKYAAGDTAWCTLPSQGAAPPVTSDPRSAGLDGPIGAKVMLVSAGVGAILIKYGPGPTQWCPWGSSGAVGSHNHDGVYAPAAHNHDAEYSATSHHHDTSYAAASHTHSGVYAAATHTHAQSDVTNLVSDLAGKAASGHTHGNVSSGAAGFAPASGGGTTNFLRADGTWAAPAGGSSPTGVLSDLQMSVLQAAHTLLAQAGVQAVFPAAQDAFTLAANSTYRVTGRLLLATGATTHTTAMAWALSGATVASFEYTTNLWSAAANAIATAQSSCHVTGVASKVLNATSTAVRTVIEFDGILVTGSGGTITPQINFSANPTGTNQTLRGSYVSLELLGADTTTKVGGWA